MKDAQSYAPGKVKGKRPRLRWFPGADTPIGRFLNRHTKLWLALYVGLMLAFLFVDGDGKWLVVPVMASLPVTSALQRHGALSDVIADAGTRGTVIALLSLIIFSAFGHGRVRAGDVISGRDYFLVDQSSVQHVNGVRTTLAGELRYPGHAGDYLFVLALDSSIEILRAEAAPAIVLHRRPSPGRKGD